MSEISFKGLNDASLLVQFKKAILADFTNFGMKSSVTLQLEQELLSRLEDGWKYREASK
jgi:hypothetical protein